MLRPIKEIEDSFLFLKSEVQSLPSTTIFLKGFEYFITLTVVFTEQVLPLYLNFAVIFVDPVFLSFTPIPT